jgi:Fe-Mn family superoxide dismutase
MPRYELPALPYAYDALEPWCPAETLELHHSKHHAAYVKGANTSADALANLPEGEDPHRVQGLRSALTFNLAGHVLHSLFWESMAPEPAKPSGDLETAVTNQFGGHKQLNDQLTAACMGVHGSGWGVLSVDPCTGQLEVGAFEDHHHLIVPGVKALAVIDVWEHAYYLSYRNDREGWVTKVLEHLDWAGISNRYTASANR